jgi:hypothetical protein
LFWNEPGTDRKISRVSMSSPNIGQSTGSATGSDSHLSVEPVCSFIFIFASISSANAIDSV